MILVTGATGHLGAAVVDFLQQRVPASEIAVMVRDEAKAAAFKEKGISVRIGDYHQYASLVAAFQGIERLLIVSSNDFNDRSGQQINAINAAREAGVRHVVYTSAIYEGDISTSPVHFVLQSHADTDQYLKTSGLAYTILHNNLYADILPMFLGAHVAETGIYLPAGTGRVPFASRRDMAEAAAVVLTAVGHEGKAYRISAGTSYSFAEIAALCSELAGKDIRYTDAPVEAFTDLLRNNGVPAEYIAITAGFAAAIAKGEFDRPDNTLEQLIGHPPMALKTYLRETFFPGV